MPAGYQHLDDDIDLQEKGLRKLGFLLWAIAYYITPGLGFIGIGGLRQLASYALSLVVFPASHPRLMVRFLDIKSKEAYLAQMDMEHEKWKSFFHYEKLCYKVGRKAKLEGVRLSSPNSKPNATDVHVFYLMGNGVTLDRMYDDMHTDTMLAPININLIAHCINPRGVAKSTGRAWSTNDLVEDHYKIIKHHIDQDIREGETKEQASRRFNIKGHSLGSGYGALVAVKLHQNGYPVNFHNGASFSTTARAVVGGKPILAPFSDFILWLTGWHMPSADAFNRLPPSSRSHHVIKAGKAKEGNAQTDGVINYYGSLHYALKSSRKKEKKILSETIDDIEALMGIIGEAIDNALSTESSAKKNRLQLRIKSHEKIISNWYFLVMGKKLEFYNSGALDDIFALNMLNIQLGELQNHYFKANKMTSTAYCRASHNIPLNNMKGRSIKAKNGHQWYIENLTNKLHFHQNHTQIEPLKKPRSPYFMVRHKNALLLSALVGLLLVTSPWTLPLLTPVMGVAGVINAMALTTSMLNIGLSFTSTYAFGLLIDLGLIVMGGLGLDVLRVRIENSIQDTDKLDIADMANWKKGPVKGDSGIEFKQFPSTHASGPVAYNQYKIAHDNLSAAQRMPKS